MKLPKRELFNYEFEKYAKILHILGFWGVFIHERNTLGSWRWVFYSIKNINWTSSMILMLAGHSSILSTDFHSYPTGPSIWFSFIMLSFVQELLTGIIPRYLFLGLIFPSTAAPEIYSIVSIVGVGLWNQSSSLTVSATEFVRGKDEPSANSPAKLLPLFLSAEEEEEVEQSLPYFSLASS